MTDLEKKAEEWRKNYTPMGITCIERDGVVIETQSKATKIIKEPNPFRIKDGWFELYLRDLDNAYIAGATEETKLLSEHILKLQKTNGSLTDRVNELFNTLSTECQERQELVNEYEKENKEAREIIKLFLEERCNKSEWKDVEKRAEQFLNENSTYERIQKAKYNYID